MVFLPFFPSPAVRRTNAQPPTLFFFLPFLSGHGEPAEGEDRLSSPPTFFSPFPFFPDHEIEGADLRGHRFILFFFPFLETNRIARIRDSAPWSFFSHGVSLRDLVESQAVFDPPPLFFFSVLSHPNSSSESIFFHSPSPFSFFSVSYATVRTRMRFLSPPFSSRERYGGIVGDVRIFRSFFFFFFFASFR